MPCSIVTRDTMSFEDQAADGAYMGLFNGAHRGSVWSAWENAEFPENYMLPPIQESSICNGNGLSNGGFKEDDWLRWYGARAAAGAQQIPVVPVSLSDKYSRTRDSISNASLYTAQRRLTDSTNVWGSLFPRSSLDLRALNTWTPYGSSNAIDALLAQDTQHRRSTAYEPRRTGSSYLRSGSEKLLATRLFNPHLNQPWRRSTTTAVNDMAITRPLGRQFFGNENDVLSLLNRAATNLLEPPPAIVSSDTAELSAQELASIPRDANNQLTSLGSIPHAEGLCRPCVFVNNPKREGCANGLRCGYCHFPHVKKKVPRPSKHQRILRRAQKAQEAAAAATATGMVGNSTFHGEGTMWQSTGNTALPQTTFQDHGQRRWAETTQHTFDGLRPTQYHRAFANDNVVCSRRNLATPEFGATNDDNGGDEEDCFPEYATNFNLENQNVFPLAPNYPTFPQNDRPVNLLNTSPQLRVPNVLGYYGAEYGANLLANDQLLLSQQPQPVNWDAEMQRRTMSQEFSPSEPYTASGSRFSPRQLWYGTPPLATKTGMPTRMPAINCAPVSPVLLILANYNPTTGGCLSANGNTLNRNERNAFTNPGFSRSIERRPTRPSAAPDTSIRTAKKPTQRSTGQFSRSESSSRRSTTYGPWPSSQNPLNLSTHVQPKPRDSRSS